MEGDAQSYLSLGLRYSNETPFNTKYGQMSEFDPAATDPVSGKLGAVYTPLVR